MVRWSFCDDSKFQDCARHTGLVMRVMVCVNFLAGLCYLIFACTVEFPVQSFPAVGMVLLGVLSFIVAIIGIVGSYHKRVCLGCFLVLGGVATVLQMALVISLHENFEGVLNKVDPHKEGKYDREHVSKVLEAAKWVLMIFLLVEILNLFFAILLRYCIPPDPLGAYDNFDAQQQEERMLSMQSLRRDMEMGRTATVAANTKSYDRLRSKMASKYGQFTHGMEWKKKSWFSRT